MKSVVVLATGILAACVPVTERYYLPVDIALTKEGTICGSVPWGHAILPLTPELGVAVDVTPSKDSVSALVQISIPTGTRVRFVEPRLQFVHAPSGARYDAPLSTWQQPIYGRGGKPGTLESFEPGALLEGRGRNADLATSTTPYLKADQFRASASAPAIAKAEIDLVFPSVEVDGSVIPSRTIPLRLVEKTGVMACVQ